MDALALETCALEREKQAAFRDNKDWRSEISLD
jgi:hypothetical protein